jgi:hypothetical protein
MEISGIIIFYFVLGFLTLLFLTSGIIMYVLWRRRKLTFCNFLSETGQWERKSFMPNKIEKEFDYDKQTYKFDICKCTRDFLNRPIAHYYKGNPEQQLFEYSKGNKSLIIDTKEITGKDFLVLMTSKVLRDIFQDEEVMNMLMLIMIIVGAGFVITWIIIFAYTPKVQLDGSDNETINMIATACKNAITRAVVKV